MCYLRIEEGVRLEDLRQILMIIYSQRRRVECPGCFVQIAQGEKVEVKEGLVIHDENSRCRQLVYSPSEEKIVDVKQDGTLNFPDGEIWRW